MEKKTINLTNCINVIIVLFLPLHTCQRNTTVNNYPREREKSAKYFCNMHAVTRIIWNALQVYFLLQTTKNPCGSKTCTCRKYGIRRLRFCGECRGTECTNSKVSIRTLKRAKPSKIEKRKITIFSLIYILTKSMFIISNFLISQGIDIEEEEDEEIEGYHDEDRDIFDGFPDF